MPTSTWPSTARSASCSPVSCPRSVAQQLFLNEHREYGASLYDTHSDGSGVCYSSRLRPILNMRPKAETPWACFGEDATNAREFILDMYVEDWLTHFGFEHDVITDEDVHREGIDLLKPYHVLITGGHPEYYSKAMRDAVHGFTQQGGRLMYLGGNGFYWRVAMHKEVPGVIEVRRCEAAIRTWEADPGEYYHSFTGEYGGIWRHQGDFAPQRLAGVGFVAEGFDKSSYYRRMPGSFDPRASFIFEGIGEDELIGDFGYHGEGAAGNELDATDSAAGHAPARARSRALGEPHRPLSRGERGGAGQPLRPRRHRAREGQGRHGLLRDAERRRSLLGGLDLLPREPAVERLRQQHREAHHQRPPPLRRP